MPPRRQSKRASQKESDERLSIAETIAGLANSIEQPAFSASGVVTRRNSYESRSAADFSGLPSMVAEEVEGSAVSLPARSASVDGVADTVDRGHRDKPTRKLRSQPQVCVQNQPSVCNASSVTSQTPSQLSSTVTASSTSENMTCMESDGHHADTSGCPVPMSFNSDAVFSAVLMGWNPPVLASSPSVNIEPVSLGDVYSPLSALKTVEPANNNSNVEVLKLPLVLEHISDGTWQLVPISAPAAFGAGVLPNNESVMQTVAQQHDHSIHPPSSDMAQVGVVNNGSELVNAVDNSHLPRHSLGSLSALGNYYNGSVAGLTGSVTSGTHQELSSIISSVSCSTGSQVMHKSSVSSSHSVSDALSSEDAASHSSILGSLGALRDFYRRIRTATIQPSSLTTTAVQMLTSAAGDESAGRDEISCTNALASKIPAVSVSICDNQVVKPVLCSKDIAVERHFNTQPDLTVKSVSECIVDDTKKLLLRNASRVLPAVSAVDSTDKQSFVELQPTLDRSNAAAALLTDEQRSCQLLRHLPPKKRQKVSDDIHCETEQNGCQYRSSSELNNEQAADDNSKNVNVDAADILLTEEIVTHEQPLSTNDDVPGLP